MLFPTVLIVLASYVQAATFTVTGGPALAFSPSALTINVGDTVVFTINGNHAVQHGSGCSPAANALFSFTSSGQRTFTDAGTFPFYCPVGNHCASGMVGSITVNAAPAPAPVPAPAPAPAPGTTPAPAPAPGTTPAPAPSTGTAPSPATGTSPSSTSSTPSTTAKSGAEKQMAGLLLSMAGVAAWMNL